MSYARPDCLQSYFARAALRSFTFLKASSEIVKTMKKSYER